MEEILTDHAWCEQKAAVNAISLITINSEKTELVTELLKVAIEEMEHFKMVHDIIKVRGYQFGRERRDNYVGELMKFIKKGGSRQSQLVERLLFAAMVEARSCERFRVLSENIKDEELRVFYKKLMISEAGHYKLFLNFAKKYGKGIDVEKRWCEWLEGEAKIIVNYGNKEGVHG